MHAPAAAPAGAPPHPPLLPRPRSVVRPRGRRDVGVVRAAGLRDLALPAELALGRGLCFSVKSQKSVPPLLPARGVVYWRPHGDCTHRHAVADRPREEDEGERGAEQRVPVLGEDVLPRHALGALRHLARRRPGAGDRRRDRGGTEAGRSARSSSSSAGPGSPGEGCGAAATHRCIPAGFPGLAPVAAAGRRVASMAGGVPPPAWPGLPRGAPGLLQETRRRC